MKVAVALSGGVDSFTAALILKERGHEVFGLFMYVVDEGEMERSPAYLRAQEAAELLGLPLYGLDLRGEFEKLVVRDFLAEYLQGRTPNPCILCNLRVKFGLLASEAKGRGAEAFATGHYVRKTERDGRSLLLRGRDRKRDQSYFLWPLRQEQLRSSIFPLGDLEKEEVKEMAASHGYPVERASESREICFIPDGDYRRFLEARLPTVPPEGEIVDLEGRILGRHKGVHRFTVGQRRGLGIKDRRPYYVVRIEPKEGRIVVGRVEDLYSRRLRAKGVNWVASPPGEEFEAEGQVRYRQKPASCRVIARGDELICEFSDPQRAVTPGQAIVLYRGDVLLGGGWIEEVLG